ncbi:MAG TPA: ferric reductase-like transmembrane domain-containing protein [Candidatus Dormibacteraeota bacterium]|nr:ferric reductase-like transmembrane domain-containing protein [Candidatus Dormibacteraeota bacterium]
MTSLNPLWLLDRSAGEVTLLLLTVVLILGVLRSALPAAFPFLIEGAHVQIALLTIVFAGLHVLAAILDPFAHLGPIDAVLPFGSTYRGTWLGLGVISAYLYASAILTSWPARRIPRSSWVWVHRLMYGGWLLAVLHSLGTGSDARNELFLFLDLAAVMCALVVFLAVRVAEGWARFPLWWSVLAVAAVLAILGIGIWAAGGPLQPGWARSSGTPSNLLRSP